MESKLQTPTPTPKPATAWAFQSHYTSQQTAPPQKLPREGQLPYVAEELAFLRRNRATLWKTMGRYQPMANKEHCHLFKTRGQVQLRIP